MKVITKLRSRDKMDEIIVRELPNECNGVFAECENVFFCPKADECQFNNRD